MTSVMANSAQLSYNKGDVLLRERPFAFVLKGSLNTELCDYCFKRKELRRCSGCSSAYYCGRDCQRNGWVFHKHECSNIKKVAPRIVPDAARLLSRILIKLQTGGTQEKSYYSETKFRVFGDLMSHYNNIQNDKKRWEHFISLRGVLYQYLDHQFIPDDTELLAIYGKMIINTFSILNPEGESLGSGVYLAASILDHSCTPNAVAVYDGTTILIRTLKDIETLDMLKVHISYIESLDLPSARQEELEKNYYFLCQCEKCLDVDELGYMTSTICQNEDCKCCIKGGMLETTLKCPFCNTEISKEIKNEIKDVIQFTEEQLNLMSTVAYFDVCTVCLRKQENLLHPLNIYKVKILNLALESCIRLQNWEGAFEFAKQLTGPYQKYYGELHPTRGLLLLNLGKLALFQNLKEAKVYLKDAASVLRITHGDESSIVKENLVEYVGQCLE